MKKAQSAAIKQIERYKRAKMKIPKQKRKCGGSTEAAQTTDGPTKQVLPAKQLPIYLNW